MLGTIILISMVLIRIIIPVMLLLTIGTYLEKRQANKVTING
jgi:competence protein ComGC